MRLLWHDASSLCASASCSSGCFCNRSRNGDIRTASIDLRSKQTRTTARQPSRFRPISTFRLRTNSIRATGHRVRRREIFSFCFSTFWSFREKYHFLPLNSFEKYEDESAVFCRIYFQTDWQGRCLSQENFWLELLEDSRRWEDLVVRNFGGMWIDWRRMTESSNIWEMDPVLIRWSGVPVLIH